MNNDVYYFQNEQVVGRGKYRIKFAVEAEYIGNKDHDKHDARRKVASMIGVPTACVTDWVDADDE